VKKQLNSIEKEFCIVTIADKLNGLVYNHYEDLEKALSNGVAGSFIIEVSDQNIDVASLLGKLRQHSNLKFKTTCAETPTLLGLYDNKEIAIAIDKKTKFAETPIYWSNDPTIIAMGKAYFETLWKSL